MMTNDVTTITGVPRTSSPSNSVNRSVASNVVSINANAAPVERAEPRETESSIQEIRQAADEVNDFVQKINRNLEFSVDDSSGRVVITVREAETGKIIRQIPPEELRSLADLVRENTGNSINSPGILIADKG